MLGLWPEGATAVSALQAISTVLVAHPYCDAATICVKATVLTYVDSVFAGSTDMVVGGMVVVVD